MILTFSFFTLFFVPHQFDNSSVHSLNELLFNPVEVIINLVYFDYLSFDNVFLFHRWYPSSLNLTGKLIIILNLYCIHGFLGSDSKFFKVTSISYYYCCLLMKTVKEMQKMVGTETATLILNEYIIFSVSRKKCW